MKVDSARSGLNFSVEASLIQTMHCSSNQPRAQLTILIQAQISCLKKKLLICLGSLEGLLGKQLLKVNCLTATL